MNIISLPFFLFFAVIFALYWTLFKNSSKIQNWLLLIGSYAFYSAANIKFLGLLIGISLLNFWLGIQIEKAQSQKRKKLLLMIGVIQGVGALLFFKYCNFFIGSFNRLFGSLNINLDFLKIIIPLGISFFTFKSLSYLLDIQKGKTKACKDWLIFFNYLSFFPTMLAGPIDKSIKFIPQLEKKRTFEYSLATDGMRQILWGLFKKVVISDNIITIINPIFESYFELESSTLILGAFLYTIQIYCDFSGYSDIAIGFSKLLGFRVTKNFNYPYFAQNVADFWRKWHMSLTAWLTEYVFTPLCIQFREMGNVGLSLAIIINFTICGFWHGSKWTFVLFGFLHGLYFVPLILRGTMNKKKKIKKDQLLPKPIELFNMIKTFILIMFTFIIFKSDRLSDAFGYIQRIFTTVTFRSPQISEIDSDLLILLAIGIPSIFVIEWFQRNKEYGLELSSIKSKYLRWGIYQTIILLILIFQAKEVEFIYQKF